MNSRTKRIRYMLLVLIGGAIPSTILLCNYFGLSRSTSIPIIVVLSLVTGSMVIWANAKRHEDGREWWQDDNASGWRGY